MKWVFWWKKGKWGGSKDHFIASVIYSVKFQNVKQSSVKPCASLKRPHCHLFQSTSYTLLYLFLLLQKMQFKCHVCNQDFPESNINEHLRAHEVDAYDDVLMKSSRENILKLSEHVVIAAFNAEYGELKTLLNRKNVSLHCLPSLEVTQPTNDSVVFEIKTGNDISIWY